METLPTSPRNSSENTGNDAWEQFNAEVQAFRKKQQEVAEVKNQSTLTKEEIDNLLEDKEKQKQILDADAIIDEINKINRALGEPDVKKADEEQHQKEDEEEHRREEAEQLANLEQNIINTTNEQLKETDEELGEIQDITRNEVQKILDEDSAPLTAVNVDWTHDKKAMAHDLAEQALNTEVESGNFIKKIWKGTLFKKYYEQKYTNEFLENKRKNPDGKTIGELIREQSKSAMERFVLSAVEEESAYVHEKNGESLERADEKTESEIKSAVEDYARRSLEPGEKITDITRDFYNEVDRIMAEAIDRGDMQGGYKRTNYLETAKKAAERYKKIASEAKTKAEQDLAMSQVMAGFKVYNAEVRDGARTEAHRDNIDKIINKLESSKIGQFIPAEIIAGAAGVAVGLTQTGARAVFGAAGGIIASSAISALRERNRITEDRVRMLRDAASGLEYGQNSKKSSQKYEKRLGGTLYDMQSASDLTSNIKEAMAMAERGEKGYGSKLLQAIAEARVRIDYSDSEQKDLISYSSASERGKERLELDKILIKAERALNEQGQKDYAVLKEYIEGEIVKGYRDESGEYHAGVEARDQAFKNYRTLAAIKKAGKTLAIGSAVFFGSQEIMAALDPAKIGVFEKAGLFKNTNHHDAEETILARAFGGRGTYTIAGENQVETISNISDPNQVARYEAAGYTKTETTAAWSEPKSVLGEVDPSESTARVQVKYDGWASNGTKIADGNEVRGSLVDGKFISNMSGNSTFNGQAVNYNPSSVKAYLTVGDAKFEIAGSLNESGQMTWGDNGVFTTTTGETIKAIGDNGEKLYKYFEIAADNGVDADGVQHIIPLATDVGTNSFADKIQQVVETTVEHPATYAFSKVIPGNPETVLRGVTTSGIAFAPEFGRTGLGEAAPNSTEAPLDVEAALSELEEINRRLESLEASEGAEIPAETPETVLNGQEFLNTIRDRRDAIGGDEGVGILTDTAPLGTVTSERYGSWWSGLSDEQKTAVRDIVREIESSDDRYSLNWGNGFRTWLMLNS